MEPQNSPTPTRAPGTVSRRAVVSAAWAAPVILAAVAAPSAVASGTPSPARLFMDTFDPQFSGGGLPYGQAGVFKIEVRHLPGDTVTANVITVVLNFSKAAFTSVYSFTVEGNSAGWTGSSVSSASDTMYAVTFTYVGSLPSGGTGDSTPVLTLNLLNLLSPPYPQQPAYQQRSRAAGSISAIATGVDNLGRTIPAIAGSASQAGFTGTWI